MKKPILAGLVALSVALVVGVACQVGPKKSLVSGDEEPIIVKNGSMDFETKDGVWTADGGDWRNETGTTKGNNGDLWVRITLTSGATCSWHGMPVQINYSVSGFQAILVAAGNPLKTKVAPRPLLDKKDDQNLRHGIAGDGGYITDVKINGQAMPCTFDKLTLHHIDICSSPDPCK